MEWVEEVPEHWDRSCVGFECSVKARLGWKGLKAEEYVDSGYIFLATPNIKEREIDFEDVNYITRERYFESPEIMLEEGDVLVTKDGSTTGTTNLVRRLPGPATVNSSIAVLRSFGRVVSSYLFYFFTSHYVQSVINRMRGGMGVPHLFQADLKKFYVCVPPHDEQVHIAGFLDYQIPRIDALIDKQRQLIALLQEKRQAVISHAVTKGLNPNAPMRDSGVEWLGQIPAHWRAGKTKFFADLRSGHTPSRIRPEFWVDCHIPWFSLADVWQLRDGRAIYLADTKETISELGLAGSAAELLPAGTVVVSRTASVGFSGIMPVPMATTQDFVNWIPGRHLTSEYLLFVFRSMAQEFDRVKVGSTHKTIYMPDVRQFSTPVPPLREQAEIVATLRRKLHNIDESMKAAEALAALLQERRAALISAAVTGKIDVRNWRAPDNSADMQSMTEPEAEVA